MTDFPKKLDEWQDEEIEIATIDPVIKYGRVVGMQQGKRTVTQKVRYSKLSEPQRLSCPPNEHDFYIPDPHNHIAHCRNCIKRQFIRAVYEKIIDGKILPR